MNKNVYLKIVEINYYIVVGLMVDFLVKMVLKKMV